MADRRHAEGLLRGLLFAAGVTCALLFPLLANAAPVSLTGSYEGMGRAVGMAMVLNEADGHVYGRMVDGQGNIYRLSGQLSGASVQGRLYSQLAAAMFTLESKPAGVEFVLIPTTSDGEPNHVTAKRYAFTRSSAPIKALADFRVTPPKKGESVDILAFLENYRGWKDKDVANAYRSISDHDRAFINKFDHLQADLMTRLCRGSAPTASIMAASESEDMDCDGLVALIDQNERIGALKSFDEVAESQRSVLYGVFACGRNLFPASRCASVNATTKRAAKTWRSVGKIFADLYEVGVRSGAVQDEIVTLEGKPTTIAVEPPPSAPPTEESAAQRKKPARIAQPRPVPAPRERPILLGHASAPGGSAVSVDELVLASADQSAEVATVRKMTLKEGLGFELRPGLGQAGREASAVASPRAGQKRPAVADTDAADVHHSSRSDVPLPRRKPVYGG